jgi:FlaA1/EpsC-like NDP-sugar epimerase
MRLTRPSFSIFVLQSALILCAWTLAWLLRFEFALPNTFMLLSVAPILLVSRLASMTLFNLLDGYWRYTGVKDIEDLVSSVAVGSAGFIVVTRYALGLQTLPLSIYVLEAVLTAAFLSGVRLISRCHLNRTAKRRHGDTGKRVLVVGAGDAAESLIRQLSRGGYAPIGCIDDNPEKASYAVHGVPVLGTTDQIPELSMKHWIDEILIAVPSATGPQMRHIVESCQRSKRSYRTVPGMLDLVAGKITLQNLREVKLEDLLGRDPVQMNLDAVRHQIENKVVMVTGAAGSIGSELCRQILGYGPAKLICLDQAETALFYLRQGFVDHPAASRAVYCLADIGDSDYMRCVLTEHRVAAIFHAAAYKHVPLMEENLCEALKNNVFSLVRLLDIASEAGCERFLLISSDKAVQPTSFMGCTKRLGELIVSARPLSGMRCLSVRFGNVLGSQGSVVPILQEQIRTTQRVTVTHPEITRYFMTIPEAVSLVLQAFTVGEHGDVLVLDMGEPIRIVDLAKTLIRLSGRSEDQVQIVFTGLRPGEKLYEELFYAAEEQLATSQKKVLRTRANLMDWLTLRQHLRELQHLATQGLDLSIRDKVKEIIPEYSRPVPAALPTPLPVPQESCLDELCSPPVPAAYVSLGD